MPALKHSLISLLVCVLMVGCGWHLKGQVELPVSLRILNLNASAVNFDTQKLLKQALLSNGITLASDASYQLKILKDVSKKRTLSVTGNAKASEYELIQTLTFALLDSEGQNIGENMEVTTYRTQLYNSEAVIAKAQEEKNLRRQMKRDNVGKLLQRLKNASLTRSEPK